MRVRKLASVAVVIFLTVTALAAEQKNPLTNSDVVKMVKAGLAEPTIVAAIAANDTQFDLSSAGLQSVSDIPCIGGCYAHRTTARRRRYVSAATLSIGSNDCRGKFPHDLGRAHRCHVVAVAARI